MRCEVVAIGTELLLGQIVDTNSSWIGEQLALAGLDSHYQTKVGDNPARIREVLLHALGRSDAVICCGGLGPTQDDLTRDVIAEAMGVELVPDPVIADRIREMFRSRGRDMPENNLRQAMVYTLAVHVPIVGLAMLPVLLGLACLIIGFVFALRNRGEMGGWAILFTGVFLSIAWTGLLRVASQSSLFLAPGAAGLIILGWVLAPGQQ